MGRDSASIFDACPHYQAREKSLVKRARELDRIFWSEYRASREAEKNGESDVVYPEGTSLYRRRKLVKSEPLLDRGWYPLLNYD